jgi:hypothetical protein
MKTNFTKIYVGSIGSYLHPVVMHVRDNACITSGGIWDFWINMKYDPKNVYQHKRNKTIHISTTYA